MTSTNRFASYLAVAAISGMFGGLFIYFDTVIIIPGSLFITALSFWFTLPAGGWDK